MEKPVVFINFKTYPSATGLNAVELAQICEAMAIRYGVDMRVAPQATDIVSVGHAVGIPVYAQHADPVEQGKQTGSITLEAVKESGASGLFINHSEHPLPNEMIAATCVKAISLGLETVVFADTEDRLRQLTEIVTPTYFCIEPPELIAGDTSVSVADPEIIKRALAATDLPVLVGAGVKHYTDIKIAIELGAKGVILSSGVTVPEDKEAALKELLNGPSQ